ncbi:MAG: class I SAM-dependent methyltransferase [Lentisphaeria bacterium]|nr:class I SAM-dependent methyltransferase [Lentisphaeria bacterium]
MAQILRRDPRIAAVHLRTKGLQAVRSRHPWIFEDSIEKMPGGLLPGDIAVLFDHRRKLGAALVDPDSDIRLRVLAFGATAPDIGSELFRSLAEKAELRRRGLFDASTSAWRLANGESDGFPGLAADRYGDVLSVKLYSAAWLPHLEAVLAAFRAVHPELTRTAIRLSREVAALPAERRLNYEDGMLRGEPGWDGTVRFLENGLTFETNVRFGQKTGFFLDQRENRAKVGELARDASKVLNVFSYSGGFSLYAARNGAKEVTDVDFSKPALEASERNFTLNRHFPGVAACHHRTVPDDAFHALRELARRDERFDVVIVDPPSFAKASNEREQALNSYSRLAGQAVQLLKKNALLVFASCSSRVRADELFDAVHRAASNAGVPLTELERRAEAPDHPADFKESHYLKCLYARRK